MPTKISSTTQLAHNSSTNSLSSITSSNAWGSQPSTIIDLDHKGTLRLNMRLQLIIRTIKDVSIIRLHTPVRCLDTHHQVMVIIRGGSILNRPGIRHLSMANYRVRTLWATTAIRGLYMTRTSYLNPILISIRAVTVESLSHTVTAKCPGHSPTFSSLSSIRRRKPEATAPNHRPQVKFPPHKTSMVELRRVINLTAAPSPQATIPIIKHHRNSTKISILHRKA